MMMVPKLFFFHNPKAAGTSLIEAIRAVGADLSLSPHIPHTISGHARLAGTYQDFRGYDLYIGHYSRDVFEAVRDGHAVITNFRHPVSRIVSLYNFFRLVVPSQPRVTEDERVDLYCVDAAKNLSFDDFVRCDHPYVRTYTSDHHFRQLTASQWVYERPTSRVEDACAFIDQALCYYVCEYPEASLRQMRARLGIPSLPHVNTTREKPGSVAEAEISVDTCRAILDINTRDMAIYRHAVARLLE